MFSNLKAFWKQINHEQRKVICMTAATDDNNDKGVERQAIEAIGFKVYTNSNPKDYKEPVINQEIDLSDFGRVMELIQKQRETRGVLVYANGDVLKELQKQEDFEDVTPDTSDKELRSMGEKKGNSYRVKLISKQYGIRGLDYRSFDNNLGICLIVLSSCMSQREYLQLLQRVGRYNEQCHRILNNKIAKVDTKAYNTFVGKVKAELNLIKSEQSIEDDGTHKIEPAGNERFEKREMQNNEQNKILQELRDNKKE